MPRLTIEELQVVERQLLPVIPDYAHFCVLVVTADGVLSVCSSTHPQYFIGAMASLMDETDDEPVVEVPSGLD
jgi:hypothetical protein